MKTFLFAFLSLVTIGFSACKKDCNNLENNNDQAISIINAVVIKSGTISFTNKNASGTATIYKQKNGKYIFALEQMLFISTVDVDVKLAKADNGDAIKLFSVKNVTDHLYSELPANIDMNSYNFLLLQSDVANAPIGTAWLK